MNNHALEHMIDVAAGRKPADLVFRGAYVNVFTNTIDEADVALAGDRIVGIGRYEGHEVVDLKGQVLCPGFIDAHVHIESSMLSVPEFARTVVACGTTAVVADPHEIANVMGVEGIRFILRTSKYCPIHVYVMLSSCVPASPLESAGAELSAIDLHPFLGERWVKGLGELMNYPGVIHKHPDVLDKIRIVGNAQGGPIDGHAPGLTGRDLCAYIAAGIRSDHEATTLDEAAEKLRLGMHVMIREGSAARNLDALLPLVTPETVTRFMFVTDDKHADDLLREGQIDHMVRRAIAYGLKPAHAIRLASFNAARYYSLHDVGAVGPGYLANLTVLNDLRECRVTRVYKEGQLVAADGACVAAEAVGRDAGMKLRSSVNVRWLTPEDFLLPAGASGRDEAGGDCSLPDGPTVGSEADRYGAAANSPLGRIIEIIPDQLQTRELREAVPIRGGHVVSDIGRDLLKMGVIERHTASGNIGLGLVRGFGLKRGAIAGSVAHDAHNIIVVGVSDVDMLAAAVHVVKMRGGLCVAADGAILADLPLPIAGLLSDQPAASVVDQLGKLHAAARALGCPLSHPFMTLSFMSLSVIGDLKLTDRGLVDVAAFKHVGLLI
jgi:adenine deaminase